MIIFLFFLSNCVLLSLWCFVQVQQPSKPGTVGGQTVQRIILPAAPSTLPVQPSSSTNITTPTSLAPIRPNLQASTPGLAQLPPGTTLLTPSTNLQGLQGFALVPAQYVTQVRHSVAQLQCLLYHLWLALCVCVCVCCCMPIVSNHKKLWCH